MLGPYYVNTDGRRRAVWGAPCHPDLAPVTLDGRTYQCDRSVIPAFQEWERIRAKHRYPLPGNDTGFYDCRTMRHDPKLPYSVHAWARALDENWLQNPAGPKLVTDMPRAMTDELQRVKTNSGAYVFVWGGDWDRNPATGHTYNDAMHWETIAHPLDLASGIAGASPIPLPEEDDVTLKQGARGNAVRAIQKALNVWAIKQAVVNWTVTAEDAIYGPGLAAAVRRYQAAANLPESGEVDGVTAALLLTAPVR